MTRTIEHQLLDRSLGDLLKLRTVILWLALLWVASTTAASNPALASVESELSYHRGVRGVRRK